MSANKHERVRLQYLKWNDLYMTVKPYAILGHVPEGIPDTNLEFEAGSEELITDVRGREDSFTLEEHGFMFTYSPLPPGLRDLRDESVSRIYLPYITALLGDILGNVEIYIFDWRLRTSNPERSGFQVGTVYDPADRSTPINPVQTVHIDQSAAGAMNRVNHHLGERAKSLVGKRVRILNVWRPLGNPVVDFPLAVCDAQTVSTNMLVKSAYIRDEYHGESLYPLFREGYQWYYLNEQNNNEILIFKSYDSASSTKTRACPHTSFQTEAGRDTKTFRESIEVRALAFSDL